MNWQSDLTSQPDRALGTEEQGAVRFSWSWFNTAEETDAAAEALRILSEEAYA